MGFNTETEWKVKMHFNFMLHSGTLCWIITQATSVTPLACADTVIRQLQWNANVVKYMSGSSFIFNLYSFRREDHHIALLWSNQFMHPYMQAHKQLHIYTVYNVTLFMLTMETVVEEPVLCQMEALRDWNWIPYPFQINSASLCMLIPSFQTEPLCTDLCK